MKKSQVNNILEGQTKRKRVIYSLIIIIATVTIVALVFFLMYLGRNKKQYIKYNENGNVDYKVYLKDNTFFEEKYLNKGNEYIASLIDYISADFNYNMSLERKNVEYKYSYKVVADVIVKEKNTADNLYNMSSILLEKPEEEANSKMAISENINIDYNYYNSIIKNFITVYGLDNIESTLKVSMYISTYGNYDSASDNKKQDSVISILIPLTTKTVAINISNNIVNTNNVILCESKYSHNTVFLLLGILYLIIDAYLIVYMVRYIIKTRTAESIYEKELKKILNNYSSYIQILDSDFDFDNYSVLEVNNFTDMLEIRDTIKQPILMKENATKTSAYFIIPSSAKMLYIYNLKVTDIKRKLEVSNEK